MIVNVFRPQRSIATTPRPPIHSHTTSSSTIPHSLSFICCLFTSRDQLLFSIACLGSLISLARHSLFIHLSLSPLGLPHSRYPIPRLGAWEGYASLKGGLESQKEQQSRERAGYCAGVSEYLSTCVFDREPSQGQDIQLCLDTLHRPSYGSCYGVFAADYSHACPFAEEIPPRLL